MTSEFGIYAALIASAFAAGVINSIAGGGTLLTFPALMAVISPAMANATSTVALMPGSLAGAWGYRRELAPLRRFALMMLVPSLLGGWVGSVLLTMYPNDFGALVPWLILVAAVLFAVQPFVSRLTVRWKINHHSEASPGLLAAILTFQFLVSVYGGFFGAGIGILMLASLGFMGLPNIHGMNAIKTLLAAAINAVSVLVFASDGLVHWPYALAMGASAILGGYAGARLARRCPPRYVRWAVMAIGFGMAGYYFAKPYFKELSN